MKIDSEMYKKLHRGLRVNTTSEAVMIKVRCYCVDFEPNAADTTNVGQWTVEERILIYGERQLLNESILDAAFRLRFQWSKSRYAPGINVITLIEKVEYFKEKKGSREIIFLIRIRRIKHFCSLRGQMLQNQQLLICERFLVIVSFRNSISAQDICSYIINS